MQDEKRDFTLSMHDVHRLIKSPVDSKIEITEKIAEYYKSGGFDPEQMKVAQDIFLLLVQDTQTEIRKTLSESIKNITNIPHELLKRLASDIEEISIPILEFSHVLTDEDLIEIIASSENSQKLMAISRREELSGTITDSLIGTENPDVVGSLLQNENAPISDKSFEKIIKKFSSQEQVMESMIQREHLPVRIVDALSRAISKAICERVSRKFPQAFEKLNPVILRSREIAAAKVIGLDISDQEYYQFLALMDQLEIADNLMPIYALALGNLALFEVYLARHTHINLANIKTLMMDVSNNGLRALYTRAVLPEHLYPVVKTMTEVLRDLKGQLHAVGMFPAPASAALISKALQEKAKASPEPIPNLNYVISLIEHDWQSGS